MHQSIAWIALLCVVSVPTQRSCDSTVNGSKRFVGDRRLFNWYFEPTIV
jgi:hypothetical protein